MTQNETTRKRTSFFPQSISRTLEDVVKPIYKKHGFAEHRILTQWNEIVGNETAQYCLPQKLSLPRGKKEGGTLHLWVAGARALELQHSQSEILNRIATYFGYRAVIKLAFAPAPPGLFKKKEKAKKLPNTPISARIQTMVDACDDAALREALLSLGQHVRGVDN